MARLILLKGPPGIGKSTIAERYADAHPGELSDSRAASIERFGRRSEGAALPWHSDVAAVVTANGGTGLLATMYDRLADVVQQCPAAIVVASVEGAVESTYTAVAMALSRSPAAHPAPGAAPPAADPHDPALPRAVAVVIDEGRVLVILRRRKGHLYAVLPGGGVEPGETVAEAAVRELAEEATLTARVGSELWRFAHGGRDATYHLMTDVSGEPTLGGSEADAHSPDNSFVLAWAGVDDLGELNLQPPELRPLVAGLLT